MSGAVVSVQLEVWLCASLGATTDQQRTVDEWLSVGESNGNSVITAIEDDRTLSNAVADCIVRVGRTEEEILVPGDPNSYAEVAKLDVGIKLHSSDLDLPAIREALATQIQEGLERGCNAYPYKPGAPVTPCIIIVPASEYVAYHQTFNGG